MVQQKQLHPSLGNQSGKQFCMLSLRTLAVSGKHSRISETPMLTAPFCDLHAGKQSLPHIYQVLLLTGTVT
jgi:hypothetical protein